MTLTLNIGDDRVYTFTVYTDATHTTPVDLTGLMAATFMVKSYLTDLDAAALIAKHLGSGIAITAPPTNGTGTITLAAADTVAMSRQTCVCALKLKDSSGKTTTVYEDTFLLAPAAVLVAA